MDVLCIEYRVSMLRYKKEQIKPFQKQLREPLIRQSNIINPVSHKNHFESVPPLLFVSCNQFLYLQAVGLLKVTVNNPFEINSIYTPLVT